MDENEGERIYENFFMLYNWVSISAAFFLGIIITPLVYYFCSSEISNDELAAQLMYEPCFLLNFITYIFIYIIHYFTNDPATLHSLEAYHKNLKPQFFLRKNLYNIDPLFPMAAIYLLGWAGFEIYAHNIYRFRIFGRFIVILFFTLMLKLIYSNIALLFCCWDTLP